MDRCWTRLRSFYDVENHPLGLGTVREGIIHDVDPDAVKQTRQPQALRTIVNHRFHPRVESPCGAGMQRRRSREGDHPEIVLDRSEGVSDPSWEDQLHISENRRIPWRWCAALTVTQGLNQHECHEHGRSCHSRVRGH
jgi:hypothetical protein